MDAYSSKRTVHGTSAPKNRAGTALKDTAGAQDGTAQFCNRLGCCGRLNHTKCTKNKFLEKSKPLKPSFRSSSSKEVIGSSSKNCSSVIKVKNPFTTESSSVSDESEIQQLNASGNCTNHMLKSRNSELNKVAFMPFSKTPEVGSSSTRVRKVCSGKYSVINQVSQSGSADSSAPQITDQGVTENSERNRYSLKSLRCNSISDVYRQGYTNNESDNGSRRRFFQGESSSSGKGKRVVGIPANEGHIPVLTSGISGSDPRNSRNWRSCRTSSASSVRTRRSLNMDPSTGSSSHQHGESSSLVQSNNTIPEISHTKTLWPLAETSPAESSHDSGCSTSDTSSTRISVTSTQHPIARFVNHNGTQRFNMDAIADVLLALERIEQDEDLTYEQLLSLEANLFLGGLNFYDQHRDMRLDIDNMSYEELLALEEKMGTVNTSLSEEELSKCINISMYESLQSEDGKMKCNWGAEDSKCSICQEEFIRGDETGRLGCGHGYHVPCIKQWLRLKNWCPVCKASPSSPKTEY